MFKGNPQRTGNTRDTIGTSMALRWSYPDKKVAEKILSSPLIHNGIVFFGSFDRHLHALNQYNGSIIWTRPTNGPVVSTPAIRDGVIYMASWDGKIYATDAEKGKPIWVYPRAVSKKAGQVTAPLLACDDGLVAACDDGQVICLQYDTGRLLWRTALDGEEGGDDSSLTVSGPAYSQGKVFVATGKGRLHCLKSSDGGTIWTFPRGKALESRFVSTPAAAASHCYVPDRSGRFYSICENTGEDSWQFTVDLDGVVEGSPSIGFGKVVVGTQTQQLVALNFNSGGEIWRRSNDKIRLIDAIFSTPVITMNRLVFVGSNSGYIYCRELESGDELWKYKLESPIRSSPAVSDGFLYVTTEAGFLHAFTQKK
jgi:outer membrane protein assembly factor BamB